MSDSAISHQLRSGDASGRIIQFESAGMSEVAEGRTPLRPFKKCREKVRDSLIGFIFQSINSNNFALIWFRKNRLGFPIRSF